MIKKPKRGRLLPKVTFDRAFYICCEIERLKGEAATASGPSKSAIENKIRRLERKITPAKKRKAIEDRRPLVSRCSEIFRKEGAPANKAHFVRRLRDEGILTKARVGRQWPISDTTAREILRTVLRLRVKKKAEGRISK
jgi:hypothetical protein